MDGGEIRILKFGWRWNKTCITRINPVRWNLTWMKVRCESRDLDGVRQDMDGGKMHILRPGWGEVDHQGSISPKCRSKCEFHLHPRPISSPSRPIDSHLASIQVVSHLNPGLYMCVPSPFRWRLSSNQVTKIASLFHPGNISNQSRSQGARLTSFQVLPDQHRGPNVLVSPPSKHHQRPNIRAACYLGLYHLHPSSENYMSVLSRHHP